MADFDYNRDHSRSFYAPVAFGNVKKGQYYVCHSKQDERTAKELGFTSEKYIRSEWPKTMWHKKSGLTQSVGDLLWTDEQNAAAVKKLGADWIFDYVPVPEPVEKVPAGELSQSDISALATIMADQKLMIQRIEELEDQITELQAQQTPPPDIKKK